jgi:CRP/FNR family transcriptional regulator, cyclic AMP receptor protein
MGDDEGTTAALVDRLSPASRERLLSAGTARHYRSGEVLFHAGDPASFVIVIVDGRAKVTAPGPEGTETVLSLRGPGDLVGELAAIDGEGAQRTAGVRALEPIRCRVVRATEFRDVLGEHPDVAVELLRMVSARLRAADRRIVEFGTYDTTRRVARLLADMAGQGDRPGRPRPIALTQDDLAGMVGASRESVVRALATLRSLGLVTTGRRKVGVVDLPGLVGFGG